MDLEGKLKELNINYDFVEHEAVYTISDVKKFVPAMEGMGCKNLFLKSEKKTYFLYTLSEDKQVNLNDLAKRLKVGRFHFAKEEDLKSILGVIPGSVTPLAIINDTLNKVTILLDCDIKNNKILVHPNRNTATVSINYNDLIKFIENLNHKYIEV